MKNNKTIYFDVDGIVSASMYYDAGSKTLKQFQYGVRDSVNMLKSFGYTIKFITGDSKNSGRNITKQMLEYLDCEIIFKKSQFKLTYLIDEHGLNNRDIIYVGDDLYDLTIADFYTFFTHKNALQQLRDKAEYVSEQTPNDYLFMDIATHIIKKDGYNIEEFTRKSFDITKFNTNIYDHNNNLLHKNDNYIMRSIHIDCVLLDDVTLYDYICVYDRKIINHIDRHIIYHIDCDYSIYNNKHLSNIRLLLDVVTLSNISIMFNSRKDLDNIEFNKENSFIKSCAVFRDDVLKTNQ